MFQSVDRCWESVSLLWALIFGAGNACVEIGLWSVLTLLIPFAAAVLLLQYVVRKLVFGSREAATGTRPGAIQPKAGQRLAEHLRVSGKD